MTFHDPFAAYNAESNIEAHMVCGLLIDAGIEAMVIEDASQAGTWLGGNIAEIHKPQVWIEKTDIERARPVLDEYEQRAAKRQKAEEGDAGASGAPIVVLCEECGKESEFPASQNGSVQNCPHCRAYVDVGDAVEIEGWDEVPSEDEGDAEPAV